MTQPPETRSPKDVLVVDSVVHRFGDLTAVDDVSFTIAPGETYGLLGPNGAGKTTTISMVAGLLHADEGAVTVAGETMGPRAVAPTHRSTRARRAGRPGRSRTRAGTRR